MSGQGDTDVNTVLLSKNPISEPCQENHLFLLWPSLWKWAGHGSTVPFHSSPFLFLLSSYSFIIRAFICPVSGLSTFEAPSFLHQFWLFIGCQSSDIHCIQVFFPFWKVELPLGHLLFIFSSPFFGLNYLVVLMVQFSCPFVPVIN